jgi:predicted O-methyltransferase YrrM
VYDAAVRASVAGPFAEIARAIMALPPDWQFSGSLRPEVLASLVRHAGSGAVRHSAETGTGKSTLLLSHVSEHHTVFTVDDAGVGDSLTSVRRSPLLRRASVEFVVGPTQQTLRDHRFPRPLDVVLIDGPHAFPYPQLEYYFLYPHLAAGALLVLDDIHIRAVNDLFRFLRDDPMFTLVEVVRRTAFFHRTDAPTFDPLGDGWWTQRYNRRVWPRLAGLPFAEAAKALVPAPVTDALRRFTRRG